MSMAKKKGDSGSSEGARRATGEVPESKARVLGAAGRRPSTHLGDFQCPILGILMLPLTAKSDQARRLGSAARYHARNRFNPSSKRVAGR